MTSCDNKVRARKHHYARISPGKDKIFLKYKTDLNYDNKTHVYLYAKTLYFCSEHRLWVLVITATFTCTHSLCFSAKKRKERKRMYTPVDHDFTIIIKLVRGGGGGSKSYRF